MHHFPCKSYCEKSIYLERKYEAVIRKYHWLVADLLPAFDNQKIRGLIQILESLPTQLPQGILVNTEQLSKFGINSNDVAEILKNGKNFRENLVFGERILQSFL